MECAGEAAPRWGGNNRCHSVSPHHHRKRAPLSAPPSPLFSPHFHYTSYTAKRRGSASIIPADSTFLLETCVGGSRPRRQLAQFMQNPVVFPPDIGSTSEII